MNLALPSFLYFICGLIQGGHPALPCEGDKNSKIDDFRTGNFVTVHHKKCELTQKSRYLGTLKLRGNVEVNYELHVMCDKNGQCISTVITKPHELVKKASTTTEEHQILIELYHSNEYDQVVDHVGIGKALIDKPSILNSEYSVVHSIIVILKDACFAVLMSSKLVVMSVLPCSDKMEVQRGSGFWKPEEVKAIAHETFGRANSRDQGDKVECYPDKKDKSKIDYPKFSSQYQVGYGSVTKEEIEAIDYYCFDRVSMLGNVDEEVEYKITISTCPVVKKGVPGSVRVSLLLVSVKGVSEGLLYLRNKDNIDFSAAIGLSEPTMENTIHHVNLLFPNTCIQFNIDSKEKTSHISTLCGTNYKIAPKSWKGVNPPKTKRDKKPQSKEPEKPDDGKPETKEPGKPDDGNPETMEPGKPDEKISETKELGKLDAEKPESRQPGELDETQKTPDGQKPEEKKPEEKN